MDDRTKEQNVRPTENGQHLAPNGTEHQGRDDSATVINADLEGFPLSFAQERLWFFDQIAPQSDLYNMPFAFDLQGALDITALAESFREIRNRHAICRTRFLVRDSSPIQVIDSNAGEVLSLVSLEHLSSSSRREEAERLTAEEASCPFDLGRGPLMRTKLLRLSANEHILLITLHHIIADAWSLGVLLSELQALYAAHSRSATAALPNLPIQYVDYAVWQRQIANGEAIAEQLKYWKEKLHGTPDFLNLPLDRPRPTQPVFAGGQQSRRLAASTSKKVLALAQNEGLTPFMVVLAAYQVLLALYTGQFDIPVLCALANRDREETQGLIGPIVNVVVLRTILANNPKVREVLQQVRDVVVDTLTHQDVPFEMLVQHLGNEHGRDPGRLPLSQVAISIVASGGLPLNLDGLNATPLYTDRQVARTDLTLFVETSPDGFGVAMEYNSALFEAATIDRMLKDFESCLAGFIADTDRRILSIRLFETDIAAMLHLPQERVQHLSRLTPTQHDIYVANQLSADPKPLRVVVTLPLGPDVSPSLWRDAIKHVLDHEEITHTRFVTYNHQPYEFVDPELSVPHEFIDLGAEHPRARTLEELANQEISRQFNIQEGQLYRSLLVKTVSGDYVAFLTWHHITCDGTTSSLVFRKTWEAYACLERDEPLPELRAPSFYDFIADSLASFDTPEILAFWAAETSGVTALECQPDEKTGTEEHVVRVFIEGEELDNIRQFCATNGCGLAAYIIAAYGLTIQRYCSPTGDFIVSHVQDGRKPEQRATLGCFYHILPMVFRREVFDGNPDPLTYVRSVMEFRRQVARYKRISGAQQSAVIAETSRPRFFYNFIGFLNINKPGSNASSFIRHYQYVEPNEVHLNVLESKNSLEFTLYFHDTLFDDDQFLQRVRACTRQMITAERIDAISMLLESDHRFDTVRPDGFPLLLDRLAHDLIAEQAQRTPEATAVIHEGKLSYRELNERADLWAGQLHRLGVGPETLVALLGPRNTDFLAAILAILKAGGAFLPLDPEQPAERIGRILRRSGSSFLVAPASLQEFAEQVQEGITHAERPALVHIEDLEMHGAPLQERAMVRPQSLGYVIYTSGSTGDPKGAMITHDGMLNHLRCKVETLGLTNMDVLGQSASQAVDVSVWQFLTVLLVGGCVRIIDDEVARDPQRLLQAVDEMGLTILEIVPSMLRAMLVELEEGGVSRPKLSTLRWLIVNGEVLPAEMCREWLAAYPNVPLINAYGPTECSDDVTQYYITQLSDVARRRVPVGEVLPNLRIHVLDPAWRPAPLGVAGHLHVGGVGVGRGYRNDPVRTAEAFIPDPFSSVPGARLYRTGDLGRYGRDGLIDFLARIDFQVKIRGYRVELGEIEAVLLQHPGVNQAVVTAYTAAGNMQLAAYIVPRQPNATAIPGLFAFLKEHLPDYMMPSAFVMIDSMPLLTSGKINRKALPPPTSSGTSSEAPYVAPRTPTEDFIASVWVSLLSVAKVGIHDDFFLLGGHSLLATQVASRLRQAYDIDLPLKRVFDSPTLIELAEVVEQIRAEKFNGEGISDLIAEIKNMSPDLIQQELAEHFGRNMETREAVEDDGAEALNSSAGERPERSQKK
ncbi:MAG TPA: amino acid adenylation domain-containing protein [Candidatus Solibacter sp.]|nr:amino acid adenylation domain-containing protein [Candidatus Solibacter sp.]